MFYIFAKENIIIVQLYKAQLWKRQRTKKLKQFFDFRKSELMDAIAMEFIYNFENIEQVTYI